MELKRTIHKDYYAYYENLPHTEKCDESGDAYSTGSETSIILPSKGAQLEQIKKGMKIRI